MESLATNPNDALVYHFNQKTQDTQSGGTDAEESPLDVSSIIANGASAQEAKTVELWVNGVKRVIHLPVGDKSGEEKNFPAVAESSLASVGQADLKNSGLEPCDGAATAVSQESSVSLRTVSTNTIDQLPNRCVATVAPQINHKVERLLVSSPHSNTKLHTTSVQETVVVIKEEKPTLSKDLSNFKRQHSAVAPVPESGKRQFAHQRPVTFEDNHRESLQQRAILERCNPLLQPSAVGQNLPAALDSVRNANTHLGNHAGMHEGNSTGLMRNGSTQFMLPQSHSIHGRYQHPLPYASFPTLPVQVPTAVRGSRMPCGIPPGRELNHVNYPKTQFLREPSFGSSDLRLNRVPHILQPRAGPSWVSNESSFHPPAPKLPVPEYRHLLSALGPAVQPADYGMPYPVSASYARQSAPILRHSLGEELTLSQFPVRLPANELMVAGTSFISHQQNPVISFAHDKNLNAPRNLPFSSNVGSPDAQFCGSRNEMDMYSRVDATHGSGLSFSAPRQQRDPLAFTESYPLENAGVTRVCLHSSPSMPNCIPGRVPGVLPMSTSSVAERSLTYTGSRNPTLDNDYCPQRLSAPLSLPLLPHSARPFYNEPGQHGFFPQTHGHSGSTSQTSLPLGTYRLDENMSFSHPAGPRLQSKASLPSIAPTTSYSNMHNIVSLQPSLYSSQPDKIVFSPSVVASGMSSAAPAFLPTSLSSSLCSVSSSMDGYFLRLLSPALHNATCLLTPPFNEASNSCSDTAFQERDVTEIRSQVQVNRNPSQSSRMQPDKRDHFTDVPCSNFPLSMPVFCGCSSIDGLHSVVNAICTESMILTTLSNANSANPSTTKESNCANSTLLNNANDTNHSVAKESDRTLGALVTKEIRASSADDIRDCQMQTTAPRVAEDSRQSCLNNNEVLPEANGKLPSNNQLPDQQGTNASLPESPQSQLMSELLNSMEKISDDISMQKWLDSLMDNITESSRDSFDCQAKSKPSVATSQANTIVQNNTSSTLCSSSKQSAGFTKNKRSWIGIKSIEAEMSPESSNAKCKRRKRRQLTLRSDQSPDQSCDGSSDSWHPDSSASSESSLDGSSSSVPASRSPSSSSWRSDDSITIGRRYKNRSRNSTHSKGNRITTRQNRRVERMLRKSPWRRTLPHRAEIRECFVSLELLCMKGKDSVSATGVGEFLCCSAERSKTVGNQSDSDDSYKSWQPFKQKKRLLELYKPKASSTFALHSGSDSDDSRGSWQPLGTKKRFLRLQN